MLRIVTVVGARPQFVKAAVLSRLMLTEKYKGRMTEFLVHTGQHYDDNMSAVFFREMEIPEPQVNLGIGSGSHGRMTGEMLAAIEAVLVDRRPDLVMVYGDTNSTLAAALAASKIQLPVAHVEAGLRSFNTRMPEEINRVLTDHVSSWLFCPTGQALRNLQREGIPAPRRVGRTQVSLDVGDVMLDASLHYRTIAEQRSKAERVNARLDLPGRFGLLTIHRAENTDDPRRLGSIIRGLNAAADRSFVFPVHPRARKCLEAAGVALGAHVRMVAPVGYLDMLELEARCERIVTDSGGMQKEAFFFGKPCITLRDETEWVETVEAGWNILVGASENAIAEAIMDFAPQGSRPPLYGDGNAGAKILEVLCA